MTTRLDWVEHQSNHMLKGRRGGMTTKYKSGDRVEVVLNDDMSKHLNEYSSCIVYQSNIIAHHPAPAPVVWWVNVYSGQIFERGYSSRIEADKDTDSGRTCVLRLEWVDGDTSKKPSSVTVESV